MLCQLSYGRRRTRLVPDHPSEVQAISRAGENTVSGALTLCIKGLTGIHHLPRNVPSCDNDDLRNYDQTTDEMMTDGSQNLLGQR